MSLDPLAPIRLGFRAGIGVLRFELRLIEHLLGLNGDEPEAYVPRQPAAPARPVAPEPEPEPEPGPVEPPLAAVAEPEPEPEEPVHVDTEPELVAEFSEPGAEDGAGAEIHVAEPWDGYKKMRVADVRDRVAVAGTEELAVVQLYEMTHRRRRSILDAVERRTKELANAPAGR